MITKNEWRPLPDFLTVKSSRIDGLGIVATKDIPQNTELGISHIFNDKFKNSYIRTPLGGFINHHEIPNSKAEFFKNHPELGSIKHIRIKTMQPIKKGEELTVKYIINQLKNPCWEVEYEVTQ